jgi:hypothetical protein
VPRTDADRSAKAKARKARNQKAWRARNPRRGDCTIIAPVPVPAWLLQVMIDPWGCIQESESEDRAEVGKAIAALLEDAALHSPPAFRHHKNKS